MKTSNVVVIIIAAIFILGGCSISSSYNTMVNKNEGVKAAWSQVENVYQRRSDLIPNLVATVKGYATHENSTLTSVVEARAKATSITIDPSKATPTQLKAFTNAQGELGAALGKLMMVKEAYPELKANQNFLELQSQLEGTENRISVERRRFNESAQGYNTYIRTFPNNILSNMFGFTERAYFEADTNAKTAPQIKF